MRIGEKIKEFGVSRYGSVKEFAKVLEMHPSTLQSYFRGINLPGTPLLQKLSDQGCDMNWLFREADTAPPDSSSEVAFLKEENANLKSKLSKLKELLNSE